MDAYRRILMSCADLFFETSVAQNLKNIQEVDGSHEIPIGKKLVKLHGLNLDQLKSDYLCTVHENFSDYMKSWGAKKNLGNQFKEYCKQLQKYYPGKSSAISMVQ